ncbi:MAG: hypothetical protein COU65_04670 [Candidatus Pacebacteria bacterium CG10_big_fil_rev_8_21_14_0_10_42_12]|nr:hypothetical protein [Candidatus Paceibacterota bacterium]PIR62196.1 MAG: hypothetical protein COU65_04670 [Candidatus Pacebacteria bacterium CG10_big_fil_rev_8_21_14_0_10_42_12]
MPIVIRAKQNDSTNDVIKRFKRAITQVDIVQKAKDGAFFVSKAAMRASKRMDMNRLRRRARSLKRMKNVSELSLQRINDRLH